MNSQEALQLLCSMAVAVTRLHEFTVLRADDVRPSRERENQSEITDHNEREQKLKDKDLYLKKIQEELEQRQSQFDSMCKSRNTQFADREKVLKEKEEALKNLQREWSTRVAQLERQLTEKESALRDLQLELDSLKKQRRVGSEDEGQPSAKKRKLMHGTEVSLMDRCIIVTIM
jgi:predicted RNase H-like nuclease (RuvC/YqgF family)